ncbi:hypothetical protein PIROE2DRAFT_1345 [Piromyces sp. E2]|nr:hypothetical protein PIROE2DRAFT_1345 [Piromyces sp. E2]|eukprot:OUM70479.1 hypothetical protein PIROE2DRAFT_1345 [Piromyces sp. E2]
MELSEIEVSNSHTCDFNTECTNKNDLDINRYESDILLFGPNSEITIINSYFTNINGIRGFASGNDSVFTFRNNTYDNCYFKKGIFYIDNKNGLSGKYHDEKSKYINIKSEYGSVIHINNLKSNSNTLFDIKKSIFKNNNASKYGGIIYSLSEFTRKYITLEECTFENNTAQLGNVLYSLNKESEPQISNIDELRKEKGAIATNPTKVILNDDSLYDISVMSGEKFPEGISCSIYDDYDNLITFDADISHIEFNEFMFYKLEVNDTYNVELYGQTHSYCWGEKCLFPQIKSLLIIII